MKSPNDRAATSPPESRTVIQIPVMPIPKPNHCIMVGKFFNSNEPNTAVNIGPVPMIRLAFAPVVILTPIAINEWWIATFNKEPISTKPHSFFVKGRRTPITFNMIKTTMAAKKIRMDVIEIGDASVVKYFIAGRFNPQINMIVISTKYALLFAILRPPYRPNQPPSTAIVKPWM